MLATDPSGRSRGWTDDGGTVFDAVVVEIDRRHIVVASCHLERSRLVGGQTRRDDAEHEEDREVD